MSISREEFSRMSDTALAEWDMQHRLVEQLRRELTEAKERCTNLIATNTLLGQEVERLKKHHTTKEVALCEDLDRLEESNALLMAKLLHVAVTMARLVELLQTNDDTRLILQTHVELCRTVQGCVEVGILVQQMADQ